MFYKKNVIKIIDNAQTVFEDCWNTLSKVKSKSVKLSENTEFLEFQGKLANQIYNLNIFAEKISIEIKNNLENEPYKSKLIEYREKLNIAASIGISLGDAYAWIFYMQERDLLNSHLKHCKNPPYREKIGLKAEIKLIETIHYFKKYFIIYHGITSYLRLGDISLYCFKNKKIVSIAEIKTKKMEYFKIHQVFHFVGLKDTEFYKNILEDQEIIKENDNTTNYEQIDRLNRQIESIANGIKVNEKEPIRKERVRNYDLCKKLNTFIFNSKKYIKLSNLLVLVKIKNKHKKLSNNLFSNYKEKFERSMDGINELILKIIDKNRYDNSLCITGFHYSNKLEIINNYGIPPTFWLPIKINNIKKIIFLNTIIKSIFNPEKFENLLLDEGFIKDNDSFKYKNEKNGVTVEIPGLSYYHSLICQHFISEKTIIDIVKKYKDLSSVAEKNMKVDIDFKYIT